MTALLLVLPKEVPSQNKRERWHWRVQRREVRDWELLAASATDAQRVGAWSSQPLVGNCSDLLYRHDTWTGFTKRTVCITSYRARLLTDHANLVGGCKGLIDGLVRAGLLVDDADEWMSATYFQELRSHPCNPTPKTASTVVEIDQP